MAEIMAETKEIGLVQGLTRFEKQAIAWKHGFKKGRDYMVKSGVLLQEIWLNVSNKLVILEFKQYTK